MLQYGPKPLSRAVLHPLPAETQERLDGITRQIHERHRSQIEAIIATGKDLHTVKEMLPHGDFMTWLQNEFGWSQKTANNYMNAADQFADKVQTIQKLAPTAVYALAAPSTPERTRAKIVKRLDAGEEVETAEVKKIVKKARQAYEKPLTEKQIARRKQREAEEQQEQARWEARRKKELRKEKDHQLKVARLIVDVVGDRGPELLELLSHEEYRSGTGALGEVRQLLTNGKTTEEQWAQWKKTFGQASHNPASNA